MIRDFMTQQAKTTFGRLAILQEAVFDSGPDQYSKRQL